MDRLFRRATKDAWRRMGKLGAGQRLLPVYRDWLTEQIKNRRPSLLTSELPTFSILTSVYINTDAALFKIAAASVFKQSVPVHEWLVLAHGPISADLEVALSDMQTHSAVKIHRLESNLGIMGAMRFCLEKATGRYCVPFDADDLLTTDALAIFAAHIADLGAPLFLFSDEDIYIESDPRFPYWRPGWDPILNLESSYIWHACAIRRDVALDLNLYTNNKAAFCHDWDTVFSMVNSGIEPIHVPEVLYHWRHHTRSTTNNAEVAATSDVESGSIQSVRATLNDRIGRSGQPHRYEVADFPIFRGSRELYVSRKEVEPAPMEAIILQRNEDAAQHCAISISSLDLFITAVRRARVQHDLTDFLGVLGLVSSPYVIVIGDSVRLPTSKWFWEAQRLFELHQDVSIVTGRLLDSDDNVQVGPLTFIGDLEVTDLYRGRSKNDPGHFALALKPMSVPLTSSDFFIARTGHLQRYCGSAFPASATPGSLGGIVSLAAACYGGRVAYSPLIHGVLSGDPVDGGAGLAAYFKETAVRSRMRSTPANRAFGASRFAREGRNYILA